MGADPGDEKYRRAVEAVARNCGGAGVRALLTGGHPRLGPKAVRVLAGTSPEYQRHVVGRALAGDPDPHAKTAASVLVYETVSFREVVSRLERALGQLRDEAAYLVSVPDRAMVPALADRLTTLRLLAEHGRAVGEVVAGLEVVPGGSSPRVGLPADRPRSPGPKVHAASALGLVAKNLRNVPHLKPEHNPTAAQQATAVALCKAIAREAKITLADARRRWGPADDGCRVLPRGTPTRRVVTHAAPDGDAVVSAWLAERFLFVGEPVEVLFVPRPRVLGAMRAGDCLVDVGRTHDPERHLYDHKPTALPDRHDSCAARLVWDHLVRLGRPVGHLKPLVDVVFAGDSARQRGWFRAEYAESERAGVHKALAAARAAHGTDAGVYRALRRWLDAHARRLRPTRT